MKDPSRPSSPGGAPFEGSDEGQLRAENTRLKQTVQVLMNRAERSAGQEVTEFGIFQTTLVLEDLVNRRTEELTRVLERNEKITRSLRRSEARFRGLADQSLAGIAIVDGNRFTYVNSRFADTFGYGRYEMLPLVPIETVAPASRVKVLEHVQKCLLNESRPDLLEFEGRKKDGSSVDIELASSRMKVGREAGVIFVIADVTARKKAEREVQALNHQLAELAIHDPLTGLYNRRFMEQSLENELIRARREGSPVSVVMCDLDHFKSVNDLHGHQAGDKVLRTFSSMAKRKCRGSDIASRYGGEEFLLVFPGMPAELAATRAESVRSATAAARITAGSRTVHVTASFGVAEYPTHGETWEEIVAAADEAQYRAKAAGRNQVKLATSSKTAMDDSSFRTAPSSSALRSQSLVLRVAESA